MVTAVYLDEHTLLKYTLTAHPMPEWTASSRTLQSGVHEYASERLPATDNDPSEVLGTAPQFLNGSQRRTLKPANAGSVNA